MFQKKHYFTFTSSFQAERHQQVVPLRAEISINTALPLISSSMLLHLAALAARTAITVSNVTVSHSGSFCVNGTPVYIPSSVTAVAGVTCILSMIGASLIVLSYVVMPEIRSKMREILIHLSLMDFMVAAANFTGVVANFDDYLYNSTVARTQYHTINNLCLTQASCSVYGTISSVIWTICFSVYIYLCIMYEGQRIAKRVAYTFYLIAYGIPLIMTLWFSLTGKWKCTNKVVHSIENCTMVCMVIKGNC